MKQSFLLIIFSFLFSPIGAQVPLVYDQENTGSKFALKKFTAPDKLPVIRQLPDALEGVTSFSDWARRRNEIASLIQHYGIGTKPAMKPGQVKARMDGDTLIVDVTVGKETLTLKSQILYPNVGKPPYAVMIGTDMIALPRQLFADRPIATMNFTSAQVNDYKQFGRHHDRGEHNFDRLYPEFATNGAYSEWAWGMSRLIDGLQQLGPEVTKIDTRRIGVTGCSYAGKMALYCGAFDERIVLTIAQEPGGGGAAAWRASREQTKAGKNLEDLDKTDYHWFLESQKENFHGDSVYRLPTRCGSASALATAWAATSLTATATVSCTRHSIRWYRLISTVSCWAHNRGHRVASIRSAIVTTLPRWGTAASRWTRS